METFPDYYILWWLEEGSATSKTITPPHMVYQPIFLRTCCGITVQYVKRENYDWGDGDKIIVVRYQVFHHMELYARDRN